MRFGSVCSGVESASVAWNPLGWQTAWVSEIDPAACAVLAARFPSVPNLGDMVGIPEQIEAGIVEAPDVLVGGTPCQGYSVAGHRGGLADPRGQLTLSFVEIANAIDRARRAAGKPECVIVWENVFGVLSMRDNAFGHFLAALAGETVPLEPAGRKWPNAGVAVGPQRAVAWRLFDAQHFRLAQRRRRVFVVASARVDFDSAEVLLEWEGSRRDSPPSREAAPGVAEYVQAGIGTCDELTKQVSTFGGNNTAGPIDLSPALTAHGGGSGRLDFETEAFVVDGLTARRLMPVECERLQGFPDNWTRIRSQFYRHKKVSANRPEDMWEFDPERNGWWLMVADGPRFKQLGNTMPVRCMRWLGERIDRWFQLAPLRALIG